MARESERVTMMATYIVDSAEIVITQTLCKMRHRLKIHSLMVLKKYVEVSFQTKTKKEEKTCIHKRIEGEFALVFCMRACVRASE